VLVLVVVLVLENADVSPSERSNNISTERTPFSPHKPNTSSTRKANPIGSLSGEAG
jgi:hypothetical protein